MNQDKSIFNHFINLYPLQKTLRFSLKPIGKTGEHIQKKKFLTQDEERARKYKIAKKIIDEYHKNFIEKSLRNLAFALEDLEGIQELYFQIKNRYKEDKVSSSDSIKDLTKLQSKLREQAAKTFDTKHIFNKELIRKTLPQWLKEHPITDLELLDGASADEILSEFKNWTSYFKGFDENRKNIYTKEAHATGIAYRIVHENLPRFLDNLDRYQRAKKLGIDFGEVEKTYNIRLDNIFRLEYFNQCLNQNGIDRFNLYQGGVSKKESKEKGINEMINLHAQQIEHRIQKADESIKTDLIKERKEVRSCKLESLHKQILSDQNVVSFQLQNIESDKELCEMIQKWFYFQEGRFYGLIEKREQEGDLFLSYHSPYPILERIDLLIPELLHCDKNKIYLRNDTSLTGISQTIFNDWDFINQALKHYIANEKLTTDKRGRKAALPKGRQEKWLKKGYFSFAEIHSALNKYAKQYQDQLLEGESDTKETAPADITKEMVKIAQGEPLFDYFSKLTIKTKNQKIELLKWLQESHAHVKPVLEEYKSVETEELKNTKNNPNGPASKIKEYLDAIQTIYHFFKPLAIKAEEDSAEIWDKDSEFYGEFDELIASLQNIISLYNQTRNYLTKKPFSVEKYKLNFESLDLANGWDKNKETSNRCVILRKDGIYYLGIMDGEHRKSFQGKLEASGECYEKMVYKQLPGPNKMLPKVFFGDKNIDQFSPSENILRIRNHASHTKNGTPQEGYPKAEFNTDDLWDFIDFYKQSIAIHPDWIHFGFEFSPTKEYHDISEFYRQVHDQGYKIQFVDVSAQYIHDLIDRGELYLFQIYNKDFSTHKKKNDQKSNPNLHTLYWKALFDENNLKDVIYKLNGEAELFFRKASITYTDDIWKKGHHYVDKNLKEKFDYPIIKDRRYATDTYLFHVPIVMNFKANNGIRFNDLTNKYLQSDPTINIIGIDRGERHLAYYTLIDQQGKILEQGSLNNPLGRKDYHKRLGEREVERDTARKSWGTIANIKDLKEGYLSQLVHKIVSLMVKHQAIVVFEDLNFGFKKGRIKIEKQVYQKLERKLIEKLNYLVLKDRSAQEAAGLYRALQLSAPFESFKKLGKQTGWIYYVPAYHTSKVCPATGFVNLLYPRYETIKKSKDFFQKFDTIRYHAEEDLFEFSFMYKHFIERSEKNNSWAQTPWTVCSYGSRLVNVKNTSHQWETQEVSLTHNLKELLDRHGIDYRSEKCLKEKIQGVEKADFFKSLTYFLRLILQLRNSRTGSDEDWMISPVRNKEGHFFDSRNAGDEMPKNADANGAYHIALKGLIVLQQLQGSDSSDKFKPDFSNNTWYQFIRNRWH